MTSGEPGAPPKTPLPQPRAGNLPVRRTAGFSPGGLYYFEDALAVDGVLPARVVTAAGWLLELIELAAGEISFAVGAAEIDAPISEMAIFYPPFSVTRPVFRGVRARLKGFAGSEPPPAEFAERPLVFETDFNQAPQTAADLFEIVKNGRRPRLVDANPRISRLSLKAKKLIDAHYRVFPSIARVAARLGVSHAHLARQFKRDLLMTPSAYLRELRIADASFRLTRGEPIIEVSADVGYNDLSRFYKQFRKSAAVSPGACRKK